MNIVIPSFKRAGAVHGYDYFETARIVIPESQAGAYLKYYHPDRIVSIPDECDGNIARKRNWILKNIPRPLLMIDDDVRCLTMTQGNYDSAGLFTETKQKIPLTWAQAFDVIVNGFNLAHQWKCPIWGVNINTDGRNYKQYEPISLSKPVLGPLCGHLEHSLLYDERIPLKDDYDMSLQALNRHRKILRLNKYAYDCDHGDNPGGVVSMRTMEREAINAGRIMRKWGKAIIKYSLPPKKMTDVLNGRVNVPIAGV